MSSWWDNVKAKIQGVVQPAASAAAAPIAPIATVEGATQLGMGKEKKGYTSAGGKRLRKTRSASKRKGRKTARKH
jgi:hypothetical protein